MRFVYNEEKNREWHNLAEMQPTPAEGKALIEKDATDPYAWYVYGKALSVLKQNGEAVEAFSKGIACDPFYAPNYLGRALRLESFSYPMALADLTMAVKLDEKNWIYRYEKAIAESLSGNNEDALEDFMACLRLTNASEKYKVVYWIYVTCVELGKFAEAEQALMFVDFDAEAPREDYGYARSVRLFKGLISSRDIFDMKALATDIVNEKKRAEHEMTRMYLGLYSYWTLRYDGPRAFDCIKEIVQKIVYSNCSSYKKAVPIAKKLGMYRQVKAN